MKLQTRFTSVETGSKIRSAIAITTPFFSLGRKSGAFLSPYIELRFKTLKKQRSSYSVHLLRREVVTLYIVQEILNITVKSRILQTETKARRGFSFLFFPPSFPPHLSSPLFPLSLPLSSHYSAALRTPRLALDSRGWRYKRYVSDNFARPRFSLPYPRESRYFAFTRCQRYK